MNFNLGYLNWPFLKCQFVLRPLFGWMHSCLFNITPTPFILTLFISSWDSSDQNVFLCRARSIFVVGMTLCLRDSTRTDFHTDSFGISTLLGTSSSLAASTGIVHKSLANNMDGKRRRMGENKRLCLIVNKWIPARSAAEKTDTFCLWKEDKHGTEFKRERKHSEVKVSLTRSIRWISVQCQLFGGLVKEMTGHRGEKVSLKGCIDEILHWSATGFKVTELGFTAFFPPFSSVSDGDEVLFAFHEIPSAKQKERTSAWMFFAGAAFLVCVGGVSLVGASSSVAPGLSQDPMSFTSTRTAGLSFKNLSSMYYY